MFLKMFYDEKLAQASYMVGCQATGDAIVIDPARCIAPYLNEAKREGFEIVGVTETHIHADFVSGARELAARGATLYLSDEGDADWKYKNVDGYKVQLLKDGDRFNVGNIHLQVMHTPGHTPESISFLLEDHGGKTARAAMGIFTGDFVFVGDVGRPDLLEKAAGVAGTSQSGAKQMFNSLKRFRELPDYLQVWPGHGAGSACGKALGAIPSSTVGYEKMFNWAFQYEDESEFIDALLEGQPEPPKYFAVMKRVNKEGIELLKNLPEPVAMNVAVGVVEDLLNQDAILLDTRSSASFRDGHIEGTINIPHNKSFVNWAGWLIDYNRPLYLIAETSNVNAIVKDLHSIGIDNIKGYIDVSVIDVYREAGKNLETYQELTPAEVAEKVKNGEVTVVDVRNLAEWNEEGHIEGATHIMLGKVPDRYSEIPTDKPVLVHCLAGGRSAMAASILQAKGIKNVINMAGGYGRWSSEGHPTV